MNNEYEVLIKLNNEQMLLLACKAYEDELRKLMKPEDYELFTRAVSIEVFRADVMTWNDGDFKQFTLDHIDEICDEHFNAKEFHKKYPKKFKQSPWEAWGVPDQEEGDELEEV